ncbi:hypothetical protein VOLCADRAFT_102635 [Volvox carteri f. nagariensis]|uniref:Uncharacterized protein n=1 Tax=Volvox carteri f. nagariensis TaxID=3068 RepID=D8TH64_VOLCA|nr:uncharacterized protein VOLCADRAFT_102635 [Volvox carteri f. nagariensis]EFJ53016.1 hypothetical protein VOLCADRAFT_102635 [Volvox carteri f. nagariensis]|eukprot:XP_002946021.1 hypothetical protein VOLCADRAFT_102635 [Volvox carteri f. nagariensis]
MLIRLLALSRPVSAAAEVALRTTAVAGLDASFVISNAGSATALLTSRDGGFEASTSYGGCGHAAQPGSRHSAVQRRPYATRSSSPAASDTPQVEPTAAMNQPRDAEDLAMASVPKAFTAHDKTEIVSADAGDDDPTLRGLDMDSLLRVLLHPLPLGRKLNPALFSGAAAPVVQLGREALFFDPSYTLSSTMRAFHVIQRILRDDGHVLVVNPNPAMRPLMREAAHLCLNRNVWFWYRDWQPGALADTNRSMATVLDPHYCQPNRRLMATRGLALRNPLCPPGSLEYNTRHPAPRLSDADMKQLEAGRKALSRQRRDRERARDHKQVVEALTAARAREAKLLPAGVQPAVGRGGHSERLALVVALDLSYGGDAVREATERKIPTVSLLNGHSDTSHVTFPVYASESHAGFQHFFLEWLLRVVNLPAPTGQRKEPQEGVQQLQGPALAAKASGA